MKNKNIILTRLSLICFFLWINLNNTVVAQKNVGTRNQQGVVQDVTTQKDITNKNQQGVVQDNSAQKKTVKNNQKAVVKETKAQNNSSKNLVTGIITDKFGNLLAGAEVRVKNSEKMAATNINGAFELNVNEPLAIFQISHDGYATIEIIKGLKTEFEIVLQKDASNRDQKIVTKYDKVARYALGSPVATINAEELAKTPYLNLAAALVGQLPGLLSRVTNSEPGSEDYTLNIRGVGTLNGTSPLILIDGVPMSNLQGINPRDVASVSVFKDAASTILYGLQAASGIISVVTKDGDFGKARINVSANYSFMTPTRTPNMINSGDYATMRNQASLNDGIGTPIFSATNISNYYKNFQTGDSSKLYPNMNWYKTFIQPMVRSQRYNVSATGGINGLKYYTNIGYSNVGSPYKTDGGTPQSYDRFDFRSNVEVKLNKYMTTYMKVAGQVQRQNGSDSTAGSIYSSVFNLAPTMYGPLTPAGQVLSTQQETNPTYGRINKNGYSVQTSTNINTIIGLNIDLSFLTKGLSISTTGMFNGSAWSNVTGTQNYERWTGTVSKRTLPLVDTLVFTKLGTQLYTPLTLDKTVTTNYGSYFDGSLKYEKQLGIHAFSALLFARYQYQNRADLNVNGYLPYLRETSGGQLNYSLSDILFANLAASYEGTEQFAPGHQYGFFPAGSIAYIISNHDFLKNNKTITFLKLRASYGVNGNDQLSPNRLMYLDNILKTTNTFIANLSPIVSEFQKGNLQYTWEKSAKTNIGIDISLWNQLTLGLDVFREIRTDVVTGQNSVPALQGVATANLAAANLGKVQNQGFEIQLGYNKAFSKAFSMNLQTYLDFAKNTILASDELPLGSDYAYPYRQKGYSIGQVFGYEIDKSNGSGYFNSQTEITNSGLTYSGIKPRPGDFIYKDLNSDHIIDQKDMAPMGYSAIPQFCYGANLNLKWKNFDLSVLIQGVGNVSVMNSGFGYFDYLNQGSYFDNQRNAWTPERYAANLTISAPALSTSQSSSPSYTANSYYLSDRSYTRLKNVEIGYMLPSTVTKKISLESVRIYVSGNNLYTIDKMNNNDIDVESSGYLAMPINKTLNIGLNVTF